MVPYPAHSQDREQVREEQLRIRGATDAAVTGENVVHMTYTRQVVKEVLRYRPPAPMVPQVPWLTLQSWFAPQAVSLALITHLLASSSGRLMSKLQGVGLCVAM